MWNGTKIKKNILLLNLLLILVTINFKIGRINNGISTVETGLLGLLQWLMLIETDTE